MSVLGRTYKPRERHSVFAEVREGVCPYCEEELLPGEETIQGAEQVAHKACIESKLDKLAPGWRLLTHNHGNGKGEK